MLPKTGQLKSKQDFQRVFRRGMFSENDFIIIKFCGNSKKYSRFGFIISNKFSKRAVIRNLIKRRLRAATRTLLKDIRPGYDIAVWPKVVLKKSQYQVLLDNFKKVLNKNDLLSI